MNSEETQGKIPNFLITAGVIHVIVGWGFLRLSNLCVRHLTHNAYMAIIPALFIVLPFFLMAIDFARRLPGCSLTDIFKLAFGKPIGLLCTFMFELFVFGIVAFGIRETQMMVCTYFFKQTPTSWVVLLFITLCLYLSLHGIQSISRLAGFMLFPPLIVITILILLGLFEINHFNIQPFFEGHPWQWAADGWDFSVILIAPLNAFFVFLPFVQMPQSYSRTLWASLAASMPLAFLTILGTVGVFGTHGISKMAWPTVEFFHIIDYPFLLMEQAGLFFLLAWYGMIIVAGALGLYTLGYLANQLVPKVSRRLSTWFFGLFLLILGVLPVNVVLIESWFERSKSYLCLFIFILFGASWIAVRFRTRKSAVS